MILQFLNGDKSGEKRQVMPPGLGIGRETDNDIQLLIGGVSRYHAKLEYKNEKWFVRDLGSTNGTKHNGTIIMEPVQLNNGDVIAIGEQMFRIDEITQAKKEEAAPSFVFRPPTPPEQEQVTQVTQITETPKKETEKEESKEEPAGDFSKLASGTSIFGKKKKKSDDASSQELTANQKRRVLSTNVLFYILVVMIGIFCVALFWKMQSASNSGNRTGEITTNTIIRNPFTLYYEKFTITKQNSVFKFKLLLEKNQIKFSLDDLQSGRVYAPVINEKLSDATIEKLKQEIEDTNFMDAKQQEHIEFTEDNNRSYIRLVVGYDDKFNDITIKDIPLASFTKVENAIMAFLQEEIGLDPSMAESKEELLKQAKASFDLAENQFRSYKNQPGNLWRSIENYRIAMRRYEVFADKPKEWTLARDQFIKAQAMQDKLREEGLKKLILLDGQKEYKKAIDECARLMDFFPETSEIYEKIRRNKLKFEKIVERKKK